MNENAADNATDQPTTLNNGSNPDAAIFDGATPSPTDSANAGTRYASNIVPDVHIPPSGQKNHTKPSEHTHQSRRDREGGGDVACQ